MTVHPQIRAALDAMEGLGLRPLEELTPAEARDQLESMIKARGIEPDEVGGVEERDVEGPGGPVRFRLYRPKDAAPGPLPVLVYFHGGGHVIGSLDTHDAGVCALCNGGGCLVVSVNYRKGPEHKFPAAAEDAFWAVQWVHAHGPEIGADPARMAVGGDSSGANLAAVAALMARDVDGPELALQLLVYPVTDYTCSLPSYRTYAEGYGTVTAAAMHWFRGHYLRDAGEAEDWRASPLKAKSHASLAPALVITAECDVLHDDGASYAAHLKEAGVEATHTDYAGMIHGFFAMAPAVDAAVAAQAEAFAALKAAFA